MNARNASIVLAILLAGCWQQPQTRKPKPPEPPNPVVVEADVFDAGSQSAALARLAERQAKSASVTDGTRRLNGVLNELVLDGVPQSYVDSVRKAVPAIKPPTKSDPARNLKPEEIAALRAVK